MLQFLPLSIFTLPRALWTNTNRCMRHPFKCKLHMQSNHVWEDWAAISCWCVRRWCLFMLTLCITNNAKFNLKKDMESLQFISINSVVLMFWWMVNWTVCNSWTWTQPLFNLVTFTNACFLAPDSLGNPGTPTQHQHGWC